MDTLVIVAFLLSLIGYVAVEQLRRTTSTRFIGEFPDHLGRITAAIRTAAVRIDGLADCVDYGSFSRPEAFEQLRQAIQFAHDINKVPVRMVVCGEPQAISAASALWRRSLEDRLKDPEFPSRLKHYLEVLQREETGYKDFWNECLAADAEHYACVQKCLDANRFQAGDDPAFEKLLVARHAWFVRRFCDQGVLVRKHADPSDVFLWIVDGIEAMFLFAYPGANALAFSTRDPGLLRVLNSIFQARLADSQEYPKGIPAGP
jgi:hypothetical protein